MLSQLKSFFRAPFDQLDTSLSFGEKVKGLCKILGIDLALAMLAGLLIGSINELELVDLDSHAVAEALGQFSVLQILLIAVLGTPLAEELVFRLPLRYQSNPFAGLARLLTPRTDPDTDAQLAATRRAWWDGNYRYIFYGLTTAFALIHLTNYSDITLGLLLLSPLLVAPQFVMGALAGFLRVRFGFPWAFLLHALHNFVLVGFAALGTGNTAIITVDDDAYNLLVEEVSPLNKEMDHTYTFGQDSVAYHNVPLTTAFSTLLTAWQDSTTYVQYPASLPDPRINIVLKKHSGERSAKRLLLDTLLQHYNVRVVEPSRKDTIVIENIN